MDESALKMQVKRNQISDVALNVAMKELSRLYFVSRLPHTAETQKELEEGLARLEIKLFNELWGVGRHRTFENAFEALRLEPRGNGAVWAGAYDLALDARVNIRRILCEKQRLVLDLLPVTASFQEVEEITSLVQTSLPDICYSTIEEPNLDFTGEVYNVEQNAGMEVETLLQSFRA